MHGDGAVSTGSYIIVVSVFLNARHYFVANGRTGQTHPHTWRLQAEVEVPGAGSQGEGIVGFADLQKNIQQVVNPLEGALLNSHPFFSNVQPTTENLARVLFHKINARLGQLGVTLRELSVWETPTRGTVVTHEHLRATSGPMPAWTGALPHPSPHAAGNGQPAPRLIQGAHVRFNGGAQDTPFVLVPMEVAFPEVESPPGSYALLPAEAEEPAPPTLEPALQAVIPALDAAKPGRPPDEAPPDSPPAETEPPLADAAQALAEVAAAAEAPIATGSVLNVPRSERRRSGRNSSPAEEALPTAEAERRLSPGLAILGAALLILAAAALIYGGLFTAPADLRFPWGSDTWGHLWKAEYLLDHLRAKGSIPRFTSAWYNGIEPFRHWAPLPYVLLLGLRLLTGDIFVAGQLYVVLCAVIGSLSWLAFRRQIGWVGALGAAMVWLIWPDHLRVAFSEGNLPRVLGTALAPLTVYLFLQVLQNRRPRLHQSLGLVVVIHLVVLSHAMVGAIYAASLSLFALIHLLMGGGRWQDHARAWGLLVLGILTAGWWLLPSLVGGLVGQGEADFSQVIAFFAPTDSFNPTLRYHNPDMFYWGLALIPLLGYGFWTWAKRPVWSRAALLTGLTLIVITFPFLRSVYLSLPLHHLLWPTRFASFAGALFLIGGLPGPEESAVPSQRTLTAAISAGLALLLVLDGVGSAHLITARPPNPEMQAAINQIPADQPARVAILDQSALGSAPSFLLSHGSVREQIFGWAWQGATTSPNLVWLNTALVEKHYVFLFDRLLEMGTTDIVLMRRLTEQEAATGQESVLEQPFEEVAAQFGFSRTWSGESLDLYARTDGPYATAPQYPALAIGRYADNLAYLFPQVEVGKRLELDSYSLAELLRYEVVVLTGPSWKRRPDAESLVRDLVRSGVRVVVDMAGMPLGVLSKRPEFLGVYGEPISLGASAPGMQRNSGEVVMLTPFPTDDGTWHTMIPQGLTMEDGFIHYFGSPTATLGTLTLPEGDLHFAGLNLIFHASRTRDPAAISLLAEMLTLPPDTAPVRSFLPLDHWEPNDDGATLSLAVPSGTDRLIIPISLLDSLQIQSGEGAPLDLEPIHNLIGLHVEPGEWDLTISVTPTRWHTVGAVVSVLALGTLLFMLWTRRREVLA